MNFKFKILNFRLSRGTTMVEMVVVLAILTVVVGTAVGIFSSLLQRAKGISAENDLFFQTHVLFEYLSPLIQEAKPDDKGDCFGAGYEGYNYVLSHFNAQSGFYEGITFLAKDNVCWEFFLDDDGFFKEIRDFGDSKNLLSKDFHINYAQFIINGDKALLGVSQSDGRQPKITFAMSIEPKGVNMSPRVVQTTFSSRQLHIP